jgi:hypothetical protein
MVSRRTRLAALLIGSAALVALVRPSRVPVASSDRAFYFWKTEWAASPENLRSLARNHIDRLYMRFFDVEWDDIEHTPRPVAPLRFVSPPPAGIEVVPVVYIVNAVFLRIAYADVESLADHVWAKVSRMTAAQGLTFAQLQLDCDWSDGSRRNYFHFVDLLNRKLKAEDKNVSATIRLHQVKYAERAGIPPVSRGMLMFYNFGPIQADSPRSSIFNAEDAGRYASYIARYPLTLDLALPTFSWSVHSREGRVIELLEHATDADVSAFDGFLKMSPNHYSASRSFFFHGKYFMEGDLLLMETTTPDITRQAALVARRGAGPYRRYGTVALFDLDDNQAKRDTGDEVEQILAQF